MVLSAVIDSIDYQKKTCTVMIPDLQSSADPEVVIREAALLDSLGTQNSYRAGDKVWVAFIRGEKRYPIVIGRILTLDPNYNNKAGGGNFIDLCVESNMVLPSNTTFSGVDPSYATLQQIIEKLKQYSNFYDSYYTEMANIKNNSIRYSVRCNEETKPIYDIGTLVYVKTQQSFTLYGESLVLYLATSQVNNQLKEFTLNKTDDSIVLDGEWQVQSQMEGAVFVQRVK